MRGLYHIFRRRAYLPVRNTLYKETVKFFFQCFSRIPHACYYDLEIGVDRMKNSKLKELLIIIPAFLIWIADLIFCYSLFAEGYKYSLGYGVMLTPTITDEAGTSFSIHYTYEGISVHEYGVGDQISFCSFGHGYVYIGDHDLKVDLDNTHIFHNVNGARTEVTRQELFEIIRNLENGAPENTEMIMGIDDNEYTLEPLKSLRFEGEYEGEFSLSQKSPGIPKEYTNYDEFVGNIESDHQRKLIVASIFVIAIYLGLSVPMVIFAIKKKYIALYIYLACVLVSVWAITYGYNDYSHRAIGINWYNKAGR